MICRRITVVVIALVALAVTQSAAGQQPTQPTANGVLSWRRVTAPAIAATPLPTVLPTPSPTSPSVAPAKPQSTTVLPTASPSSTRSRTGRASWYDDGGGLYAAAGPALRVGDWRGRLVTVCAGSCVKVRLTDWCQCYENTDRERVIDLSPAAFTALAPLSRGLVKVEVRW